MIYDVDSSYGQRLLLKGCKYQNVLLNFHTCWPEYGLLLVFLTTKVNRFWLTLLSRADSSTGKHSWTLCCLDDRQTKQINSSSLWQNSFSSSLWRRQSSTVFLYVLCSWKDSAAIFSAKLIGGLSTTDTVRHTGHSRNPFRAHSFCRQALQEKWPQRSSTGTLNTSQHTGQRRSSSESEGSR